MATISNTPRPGYVWDSTDNVWYPIGVGGHSHSEIAKTIADAKGDLIVGTAADTVDRLAVGNNGESIVADSSTTTGLGYSGSMGGGRNFIINGAFDIDQRNNGASVTPVNGTYYPDRWVYGATQASKITAQRIVSTIAGFPYSFKITSSSAYTPTANDEFEWITRVEDKNIVNLSWGTATAKTVTLSFWVKSSLTGTFAGSIVDANTAYSYPFTYSISAANTAEYKRITIAGPTGGTWNAPGVGGTGLQVLFSMGAAGTSLGTAGAWVSAFKPGATGQTNLVATSGATWEITGIQFELGSSPTTFSRAGGTIQGELAACQRYYQSFIPTDNYQDFFVGSSCDQTTYCRYPIIFPVVMRIAPTASTTGTANNYGNLVASGFAAANAVPSFGNLKTSGGVIFVFSSAITTGQGTCMRNGTVTPTNWLTFSAEL